MKQTLTKLGEFVPNKNVQNLYNTKITYTLNSLVNKIIKVGYNRELTAFLGLNGNEKPIFLGYNYNPRNQTWNKQFACAYIYIQTIEEFKKNPMCKHITFEQPQDFIKTESNQNFINAFKKKGYIKTYNTDTKLDKNQIYSKYIPKNFKSLSNDLKFYLDWVLQATGFKYAVNLAIKDTSFKDLIDLSDKSGGSQL